MEIWLDNEFNILSEKNNSFGKGNNFFDYIKVYIPTLSISNYNVLPTFNFENSTMHKYGPFVHTSPVEIEGDYTVFKIELSDSVLSEKGKLFITIIINFNNRETGEVCKTKHITSQGNIVDNVIVDGDAFIITGNEKNILESLVQKINAIFQNSSSNSINIELQKQILDKITSVIKSNVADSNNDHFKILFTKDELSIFKGDNKIAYITSDDLNIDRIVAEEVRGKTVEAEKINAVKELIVKNINVFSTFLDLQKQIDSVNATQNLVDIVEDYDALLTYNTSNLEENDKIQVLKDENHNDAATIYNYNGSIFNYIGTIGEYYSKSQMQEILAKYATLNDLFELNPDVEAVATMLEEVKSLLKQEKIDRQEAIDNAIMNLINNSPAALDTLYELAQALGNDPNFATTITNYINTKFSEAVKKSGDTMTGELILSNGQVARGFQNLRIDDPVPNSLKTGFYNDLFSQFSKYLIIGEGGDKLAIGFEFSKGLIVRFSNNNTWIESVKLLDLGLNLVDEKHNFIEKESGESFSQTILGKKEIPSNFMETKFKWIIVPRHTYFGNTNSEEYFKNIIKYICSTYVGYYNYTFCFTAEPNSKVTCFLTIYDTSELNDEGLPRYSYGFGIQYNNSDVRFGTNEYNFLFHAFNKSTFDAINKRIDDLILNPVFKYEKVFEGYTNEEVDINSLSNHSDGVYLAEFTIIGYSGKYYCPIYIINESISSIGSTAYDSGSRRKVLTFVKGGTSLKLYCQEVYATDINDFENTILNTIYKII